MDPHDGNQRSRPLNQHPRPLRVSPDIIPHRLPQRRSLSIKLRNLLIKLILLRRRRRCKQKDPSRKPKRQERASQPGEIPIVQRRDVANTVEVRDEVSGQPAAVASQNDEAVDSGGEKAGSDLDAVVVDDVAVGCDAFGGFDAVDTGGDFEGVEGEESGEEVDCEAGYCCCWTDLVEACEEIVVGGV